MSPLRVLTVDDEQLALRRLKLLLQTMPQVDHVVSMLLGNPLSNDPVHRFFALSNQSLG